jgi:hypothetical protein
MNNVSWFNKLAAKPMVYVIGLATSPLNHSAQKIVIG